jgi:hypothetical protein
MITTNNAIVKKTLNNGHTADTDTYKLNLSYQDIREHLAAKFRLLKAEKKSESVRARWQHRVRMGETETGGMTSQIRSVSTN